MSNYENDKLYERASELIDQTLSHPAGLDKQIIQALDSGDLEYLHAAVTRVEGILAQEHFYEDEAFGTTYNEVY